MDETLDLIVMLPQGSRFRAAHFKHGEWTAEQECIADNTDAIYALIALMAQGTTENAWKVVRPRMLDDMDRAKEKKKRTREKIDNTEWVEV